MSRRHDFGRVAVSCPQCGEVALTLSSAAVQRKLLLVGKTAMPTPDEIAKYAEALGALCVRCDLKRHTQAVGNE